jgi:putative membrane protein
MRNFEPRKLLTIAVAVAVAACVNRSPTTTAATGPSPSSAGGPTTTTTSYGEVTSDRGRGMWLDSANGWWMDGNGGMRMGRNGAMMGLQPPDFAAMSNENIVAHLTAGDSLEVALSQLGVSRAQNTAVRDFAQRMVTEHTAHMQAGRQFATQNTLTLTMVPNDTMDAAMTGRVISRLSSMPAGPDFDRQFIGAEVMMHRHMLHELTMMQGPANGGARQLVDQTIPVVQQHLSDAQSIWRQLGGGTRRSR